MNISNAFQIDEVLLMYVLAFGGVVCAVWGFWGIMKRMENTDGRISSEAPPLYRLLATPISIFRSLFSSPEPGTEPQFYKRLDKALRQSGFGLKVQEVFAAQAVCAAVGLLAGYWIVTILGDSMSWKIKHQVAIAFALLMWILPYSMVFSAAKKRSQAIVKELSFAVDLIVSSMDAGLDFVSAVRYLIEVVGVTTPLNAEFELFLKDISMGMTRIEALSAMEKRMAIKEFSRFVAAVSFGMTSGSSITDIMRVQVEEMLRVRFAIAEEKAEKTTSKMIYPLIFCMLIPLFIIIVTMLFLNLRDSGTLNILHGMGK